MLFGKNTTDNERTRAANDLAQHPDGTTMRFFNVARLLAKDPNASIPLEDGTTAAFFQIAREEAKRVRQFTRFL